MGGRSRYSVVSRTCNALVAHMAETARRYTDAKLGCLSETDPMSPSMRALLRCRWALRTPYERIWLLWALKSVLARELGTATDTTCRFSLDGSPWLLVNHHGWNRYRAFTGLTEHDGTITIGVPTMPTTPGSLLRAFTDGRTVQRTVQRYRLCLAHELTHALVDVRDGTEDRDGYIGFDDSANNWGVPTPLDFRYLMYLFQPEELLARLNSARKEWAAGPRKTGRGDLLSVFVHTLAEDIGIRRPSTYTRGLMKGFHPMHAALVKWTLLDWAPANAPSITRLPSWRKFSDAHAGEGNAVRATVDSYRRAAAILNGGAALFKYADSAALRAEVAVRLPAWDVHHHDWEERQDVADTMADPDTARLFADAVEAALGKKAREAQEAVER